MDDTLVDTRDKWIGAIRNYLPSVGLAFDGENISPYMGKNCKDICRAIDARHNHIRTGDLERHAEIFRNFLAEQFNRRMPQEIAGADTFLRMMHGAVEQYIVSGSPLRIISAVVREKGWSPFIADFISSESVERGKPDPRIYDDMRQRLRAAREECLIFEDSPAGVEASRRAGIRCVCINPQAAIETSALLLCSVPNFQELIDRAIIRTLMNSESRHELN